MVARVRSKADFVSLFLALSHAGCSGSNDDPRVNLCEGIAPAAAPGASFILRTGDAGVSLYGPYNRLMYCWLSLTRQDIICAEELPDYAWRSTVVLGLRYRGSLFPARFQPGTILRQGVDFDVTVMRVRVPGDTQGQPVQAGTGEPARGNLQLRIVSTRVENPKRDVTRLELVATGQACGLGFRGMEGSMSAAFDFRSTTEWPP